MRLLSRVWPRLTVIALAAGIAGCMHLPRESRAPLRVWGFPASEAAVLPSPTVAINFPEGVSVGYTIALDSISFRPTVAITAADARINGRASRPMVLVTTHHGSRYHPETVRALTENADVLASAAGEISRAAAAGGAAGMVLDFQGMSPDDLPETISLVRALRDSARAIVLGPIGFVVPPGDTAAYPTAIIAASADLLVVRLHGEHRPGTAPGPLASPDWFARQLGMRLSEVGAARVVVEIPLFGYRWNRDGTARKVTYSEARVAIAAESEAFRRDPVSGFLTASSARDGWEIWMSDAHVVERLIESARRSGVYRFALAGLEGADPELWGRLSALLRR